MDSRCRPRASNIQLLRPAHLALPGSSLISSLVADARNVLFRRSGGASADEEGGVPPRSRPTPIYILFLCLLEPRIHSERQQLFAGWSLAPSKLPLSFGNGLSPRLCCMCRRYCLRTAKSRKVKPLPTISRSRERVNTWQRTAATTERVCCVACSIVRGRVACNPRRRTLGRPEISSLKSKVFSSQLLLGEINMEGFSSDLIPALFQRRLLPE